MKRKQLIPFSALFVAGLALAFTACKKEQLSEPENGNSISQAQSRTIPNPVYPIYGIAADNHTGSYGEYLVDVNRSTGAPTRYNQFYSGGLKLFNVYGLAQYQASSPAADQGYAYLTAAESNCGSGTAFYRFALPGSGSANVSAVKLGTAVGYDIKDIEFHTVSGKLYAISGNKLLRIESFGTACPYTTAPVITEIGLLSNVGIGPYTVSFALNGSCAIMSARDLKRAYVNISTPTPGVALPLASAITVGNANGFMSATETGSCISGGTQYIGVGTTGVNEFYELVSANPAYQYKGGYCFRDYTSFVSDGSSGPANPCVACGE